MMEKAKKLWSKMNRWHKSLLLFLLVESRWIPGAQRGFTCNDPALSHPFTGDTINLKHLIGAVVLLPLAVMLIVERRYHSGKSIKPKKQALRWYKEYVFGVIINLTVIELVKLAVGAPRPHFFDTCSPVEADTCQGSEFVERYTCTKAHWVTQSDRSFPSGHTALALHAGMFLIYYLHKRTQQCTTILSSQIIILLTSVYCGVSRMIDHRHHWWDVLAGAGIGVPILFYTIYNLCCDFQVPNEEKEDHNINNSTEPQSATFIDTKDT